MEDRRGDIKIFITLEGIDNTGKSTQVKMLQDYIGKKDSIITREPGGCSISEKIRDVLVQGTPQTMDATTELLLMNAQRREHIKQTIQPAIKTGKTVICDRYIDSTIAYQHSIDINTILGFHKQLCFNLFPAIVFLIDLPAAVSYTREANPQESRFESKGLFFMDAVRDRFLESAKDNPSTHVILNGEMSIEEIHSEICKEYDKRLDRK